VVEIVGVVERKRKYNYWFRRLVLLGHVP
jgi:hypothetical protein